MYRSYHSATQPAETVPDRIEKHGGRTAWVKRFTTQQTLFDQIHVCSTAGDASAIAPSYAEYYTRAVQKAKTLHKVLGEVTRAACNEETEGRDVTKANKNATQLKGISSQSKRRRYV